MSCMGLKYESNEKKSFTMFIKIEKKERKTNQKKLHRTNNNAKHQTIHLHT